MKMKRKNIAHAATAIFSILALTAFPPSCANTSTAPEGGPKDTIPPVLVAISPNYNGLNHPVSKKKSNVVFEFNEYVALNEPGKNIFLSPPQSKPPTAKIKGKKVVVSFQEPLDSNRSYSLSLGEAIKDNNEGNPFPPFTHSFSTGGTIDSLFVSGTVTDATTMLPMPGVTVLFHTDPSDSAIFKVRPKAAAKSDLWGYFTVRNLPADTVYRVFAIEDLNNNNLYDPDAERVAFLDTLVIPSSVMHYNTPELVARSMTDTAGCMSRPSQLSLSMFKEISTRQFLKARERPSRRHIFLKFGAPYPQIDCLSIQGIPDDKLIFEYNYFRDSITIWINEQGGVHDTLQLGLKYMKTDDTLHTLVPSREILRLAIPRPKYEKNERTGEMEAIVDTIAKYKVTANPENIDQDGIVIQFETPMIRTPFDSVTITAVNTRQQESLASYKVEIDTSDIKRYILRLDEPLAVGFEYTLKIPGRQFMDINGFYCDSLEQRFSLPKGEDLSSITLIMENVFENYIVELTDENKKKIFRKYSIDSAAVLPFPYLKAGKYSIRITEDKNGNGMIDTGVLLEKKQPEKVMLYKASTSLGNDAYILELPARTDLEQTIDLAEMFK